MLSSTMLGSASKKSFSLLDALDQSYLSSRSPVATQVPSSSQIPLPSTPLQRGQMLRSSSSSGDEESREHAAQRAIHSTAADYSNTPQLSQNYIRGELNPIYDVEIPVRAIDVGGPDQEQRLTEFVTKSIENTSEGLTVKEAMKSLGLKDNRDLLPGLEVRLLGHQSIGVAWMLEKERSHDKGGILADDMGLGKTVQMIATMAMNMPHLDDVYRTTLVVVPAALLQQWKDEIDTKSNGIWEVHVHHGKDKLKKLSELKSKDIVITSYQTLCQDFYTPKGTPPDEEEKWIAQHGGLLSRARFYRVVADEAQFIRNRATRSSTALALIKSELRWMLTGTPVTNTLTDIFGLLRFGHFRPWNDWSDFNDHVAKVQYYNAPLAGQRAQTILKPLLLRRTKYSTLEGKPLLQLPEKHIELVKLKFTEDERAVYDLFEKRTKVQINRFIREDTLLKNHAFILVLILRLRQICCHPALVLALSEGFEDPTAMMGDQNEQDLSRAEKSMGATWVNQIKQRFLLRAAYDFDDEGDEDFNAHCSNCNDMFVNDNGRILACGHEICVDCANDLVNSPIGHNGIFGYGSEKENLAIEKEYEAAVAKGYRPCPNCKKMMDMKSPYKIFHSSAFEPTDEELDAYERNKRRRNTPFHAFRSGNGKFGKFASKGKEGKTSASVVTKREPSPAYSVPDVLSSDSDDDLPDPSRMFVTPLRKKKVVKMEDSDDDIEKFPINPLENKSMKRKVIATDSEDDALDREIISMPKGKGKATSKGKGGTGSKRRRNDTFGNYSSATSPSSSPGLGSEDKDKDKAFGSGPSESVIATWARSDDDLEPSSKMYALLEYLREWDFTGDKIICYSQWTSMLNLIETLLSRHGIRSLRFDGSMDRTHRDRVLAEFKALGGPRIILISTKCGSVGLNLVSANRIVNMDLSWNYASEAQAYDRCHRIGQEKEVYVKRLVVENTIEDRMLRLQDVKTGLAEAALGEGSGAKLSKLSVKDIRYLFGMKDDTNVNGNR